MKALAAVVNNQSSSQRLVVVLELRDVFKTQLCHTSIIVTRSKGR